MVYHKGETGNPAQRDAWKQGGSPKTPGRRPKDPTDLKAVRHALRQRGYLERRRAKTAEDKARVEAAKRGESVSFPVEKGVSAELVRQMVEAEGPAGEVQEGSLEGFTPDPSWSDTERELWNE